MAVLTKDQIISYAQQAGFTASQAQIVYGIAMAESSGNTQAFNPAAGGNYGLMQINNSHIAGGETTIACAYDPFCAMQFSYKLSKGGTKFSDWETYTTGEYTKFTGSGSFTLTSSTDQPCTCEKGYHAEWDPPIGRYMCVPDGSTVWTSVSKQCQGATDPTAAFIDETSKFVTDWLANPTRLLKMVMGFAFVFGALFLLISPQTSKISSKVEKFLA